MGGTAVATTTIGNKKSAGDKKGRDVKPRGGGLLKRAGHVAAARARQPVPPKERVDYIGRARKYFQGVSAELKRVHWPGVREVAVYTVVVLISVGVLALLMWIFDQVLGYIFHFVTGA